jgi:hypothetical protein
VGWIEEQVASVRPCSGPKEERGAWVAEDRQHQGGMVEARDSGDARLVLAATCSCQGPCEEEKCVQVRTGLGNWATFYLGQDDQVGCGRNWRFRGASAHGHHAAVRLCGRTPAGSGASHITWIMLSMVMDRLIFRSPLFFISLKVTPLALFQPAASSSPP